MVVRGASDQPWDRSSNDVEPCHHASSLSGGGAGRYNGYIAHYRQVMQQPYYLKKLEK